MKHGIVPFVFMALLAVAGRTDAVQRCERDPAGGQAAGAVWQVPPAAMATMGLALLATGAMTRRSTIERA